MFFILFFSWAWAWRGRRLGVMAIFSKCMFTLPSVDSILKCGEDGRDVKTNFDFFLFFCVGVGVGVGVGLAFAWAFAFSCHVHAQGKHFQGTS
jgi:hypothetical protein